MMNISLYAIVSNFRIPRNGIIGTKDMRISLPFLINTDKLLSKVG